MLHHLVQSGPLHLFPFQVGQGVGYKVEERAALLQFLDEQLLFVGGVGLCEGTMPKMQYVS